MLSGMEGFEDWKFLRPAPHAKEFPKNVKMYMDANYPRDVRLIDAHVDANIVVISARIKEILAKEKLSDVEFLPVAIVNHKGRVASKDYFILNVTKSIDCLDVEKSVPRYSAIDPDIIRWVKKIVIDDSRVPAGARLFRMQGYFGPIIVDETIKQLLEGAKIEGASFVAVEDFSRV
jgi:hypothetical protein